ncbi:MAG: hypothetical protein ACYC99_02770 [Candidatus Geothermincolia bacterium]
MRPDRLARKAVLSLVVFGTGVLIGLAGWKFIKLPFKNPWNVIGPMTLARFNPSNTMVRYVFLVALPTVLLLLLVFLGRDRISSVLFPDSIGPRYTPGDKPRRVAAVLLGLLLVAFVLVAAINFPTLPSHQEKMDTFHEGESMGPGENWSKGEKPYKDYIFVHGPYEDPIRSALAFKLFGRSIASVRTLQSINKIVAFLLLAFLLFRLFQGDWLFTFLSLILLLYCSGSLSAPFHRNPLVMYFPERDMTAFAFLIVLTYLADAIKAKEVSGKKLFVIGALFSFFPLASFAYSIDRGFYNTAAYVILLLLLFFFFFNKKRLRLSFISSTAVGLIAALAVLGFALRWEFGAFVKFAILDITRYKELMDGLIYPIRSPMGLRMVLLIALSIFWLAFRFLRVYEVSARRLGAAVRNFLRDYLVEFALLLLAVLSFRSALGRADIGHIEYSSAFTYFFLIYVFLKHYLARWLKALGARKIFTALVAVMVGVILVVGVFRVVDRDRFSANFPVVKGYPDSHFIPEGYQGAIALLRNNMGPDENFVTMTNEASWYYFVDKPSPTRFQVVWFAAPEKFQRELVNDIRTRNVKFIIRRNKNPVNDMDGIGNERRLPIVFDYINKNYKPYRTIDGNEIWIRKG